MKAPIVCAAREQVHSAVTVAPAHLEISSIVTAATGTTEVAATARTPIVPNAAGPLVESEVALPKEVTGGLRIYLKHEVVI